jgi:hypothetical protein
VIPGPADHDPRHYRWCGVGWSRHGSSGGAGRQITVDMTPELYERIAATSTSPAPATDRNRSPDRQVDLTSPRIAPNPAPARGRDHQPKPHRQENIVTECWIRSDRPYVGLRCRRHKRRHAIREPGTCLLLRNRGARRRAARQRRRPESSQDPPQGHGPCWRGGSATPRALF